MSESPLEVILWTTDIDSLSRFLAETAGFEVLERHPGFATLVLEGARLSLHADEAYKGHPWFDALGREGAARGIGSELRVKVPDVESCYHACLRLGAVAVHGPYDPGNGRLECLVMGPDGYLFSFWSTAPSPI